MPLAQYLCLICNAEFTCAFVKEETKDLNNSETQNVAEEEDIGQLKSTSSIHLTLEKLWLGFCQYFNVSSEEWENIYGHSSQTRQLPFCSSCQSDLSNLIQLHENLKELQFKILRLTSDMATKIVRKENSLLSSSSSISHEIEPRTLKPATLFPNCENSTLASPQSSNKTDDDRENNSQLIYDSPIKSQVRLLRQHLSSQFTPRVVLENCCPTNILSKKFKPTEMNYYEINSQPQEIGTDQIIDSYCNYLEEQPDQQLVRIRGKIVPVDETSIAALKNNYLHELGLIPHDAIEAESTAQSRRRKRKVESRRDSNSSAIAEPDETPMWEETVDELGQSKLLYLGKWSVLIFIDSEDNCVKYQCEICGQVRSRKYQLSQHIRNRHIAPYSYVCSVCDMKFLSMTNLKGHQSVHSNERPFACDVPGCTSTFKLKRVLVKHKLCVHKVTTVSESRRGGRKRRRERDPLSELSHKTKAISRRKKKRRTREPQPNPVEEKEVAYSSQFYDADDTSESIVDPLKIKEEPGGGEDGQPEIEPEAGYENPILGLLECVLDTQDDV